MTFNAIGALVCLDVFFIVLVALKISCLTLHLNFKNPIFAMLIKSMVIYGRYCG
jgi:hypothetical protein